MHSLLSFSGSSPAPVLAEIFGIGSISGIELGLIMGLAGMLFGGVMAVMGIQSENEKRRQRHELIRLALEKGQPLPSELLDESAKAPKSPKPQAVRNDRRSGIIVLFVAIGIFTFFHGLGETGVRWIAAIPGAVGIALLLNSLLEANRKKDEPGERSATPPDGR